MAPTPNNGRFRLSDTQFGIILTLPALALFAVIILYPLLNSMIMAFYDKSLVWPGQEFVGLENITKVLQRDFMKIFGNTLGFTVEATLLPFVIGFAVALLLNQPLRGRGLLRGLFLLPWLIPTVVVSFLWMWIFNANYGVLNGILRATGLITENINWLGTKGLAMQAVIIAKSWNTFPWIAIMVLAGLQTIPKELYEAAAIDGANRWHSFRHITLTQLRGVITTVLLLSFIWNFQHFETLYVMTTGGPAGTTTTFSVAVYQAAFQAFDLGQAGAIGLLWMILLSVIVGIYLRFGANEEM
ncbi:MAG: sugar ABC transporter permease [Anaerolineae bacterium]|nr:sugar ABC transporter permease [Anaerolineae bacterium]